MRSPGHSFARSDLELLHRALAYRRKRVHDAAATVRLQGILDRVESLLLERDGGGSLRLSPPEQEQILHEVPLYCAELTGRGASAAGAEEARRLREMTALLAGRKFPRTEGRRWWRRLMGR